MRAFVCFVALGGAVAAAVVACSSFTASPAAEDGGVDAAPADAGLPDGCTLTDFTPSAPSSGLGTKLVDGGFVDASADGLVFTTPGGDDAQQSFGLFELGDPATVKSITVQGTILLDSAASRPWFPIVVFDNEVSNTASTFPASILVTADPTSVGIGAVFGYADGGGLPLWSDGAGSLSGGPMTFRLDIDGLWADGPRAHISVNDRPGSLYAPDAAAPKVLVADPTARRTLDLAIGVVFPPEKRAQTTVKALSVIVCKL